MENSLTPKLFTILKNYNKQQFLKDLISGITVGIIAIPLSIALSIASGVNPQMGLYTAIIGGFVIAFFGGSRVQIGGPTAAFIPIIYSIVEKYSIDGLVVASIMAGIFLIIMAICKLGRLIKYIPYPVVIGFTAGIAISIFFKQIKDFTGMPIVKMPSNFIDTCKIYFEYCYKINIHTLLIGILSLGIICCWSKIKWKLFYNIPSSLIAIIITTLIAQLYNLDIETIGSKYPDITGKLPSLTLPNNISLELISDLILPAISIAILAGIESLLSAVVADGMIGGHHRSNAELMAQGFANIASPLLGGIPATGAIARTATNIKNGGRTPIAGIIHSITILIIMLIFMPYAKMIPLTTLASVLIVVAYNMADWRQFRNIQKAIISDYVVLMITFFLTIIFDIVVAIEAGMILASFLFMKRVIEVTEVNLISDEEEDNLDPIYTEIANEYGEEILLYEIRGVFFFGAADKFMTIAKRLKYKTKVVIIKMEEVPFIDSTALHFLNVFYSMCEKQNISLYITNIRKQPLQILKQSGFIDMIESQHICKNIENAILHYKYELL